MQEVSAVSPSPVVPTDNTMGPRLYV
jgi:hypothetical protein